MAIQVIPLDQTNRRLQAAALAQAANLGTQSAFALQGRQDRINAEEAMAQLLAGTPDQPGQGPKALGPGATEPGILARLMGPASEPQGPPTSPTPGAPGLLPGVSQEQAMALAMNPGVANALLQRRFASPPGPVNVAPGASLVDPTTGQPIFTAPGAPASAQSILGKVAADANLDLSTPEGMNEAIRLIQATATPDPGAQAVSGLRADLMRQQLAESQAEQTAAAATAQRQQIEAGRNVADLAGTLDEIEANLGILEGTPLEPGTGAEELARGGAGLLSLGSRLGGMEDARSQELATAFDNFRRLTSSTAIISSLETLKDLDVITDRKFQAVRDTILDAGSTPGAIRSALADIREANARAAQDLGVELPSARAPAQPGAGVAPSSGTINLGTGTVTQPTGGRLRFNAQTRQLEPIS